MTDGKSEKRKASGSPASSSATEPEGASASPLAQPSTSASALAPATPIRKAARTDDVTKVATPHLRVSGVGGSSARYSSPRSATPPTPPTSSRRLHPVADPLIGLRYKTFDNKPSGERIFSQSCRTFIIPVQLTDAKLRDLNRLLQNLGALGATFRHANILITQVKAPKRVEREVRALCQQIQLEQLDSVRAVDAEDAEKIEQDRRQSLQEELSSKLVLHSDWLVACEHAGEIVDFEPYLLLGKEEQGDQSKASQCPPHNEPNSTQIRKGVFQSETGDDGDEDNPSEGIASDRSATDLKEASVAGSSSGRKPCLPASQRTSHAKDPAGDRAQMTHTNESIDDPPPWENSSSACRRPTPLKSKYNQDLVDMLDIVQRQRALLDDKTALPYARAVSIIKSYPEDLRQDPSKAKTLKGVGPKTFKMVRQYYELGKINEAEIIRRDYAFRVLSDFTQIYKIGPKKARELYAQGYRRIEELIVAKEWRPGKGGDIQVPEALRILPDLQVPISREEVEEIVRHIKAEMDEVIAGTEHTIVGGYRRGKTSNNDVDVIFTYPSGGPHGVPSPSQMQELRERLERKGLITHYISLSNMNGRGSKSDGLHTMEIVFKAPRSPIVPVSRHRRVDIIFCRYRVYGAAILGWTGSKQFERDLRVVAQQEGYKFNSDGLVEKDTSRTLDTFTERQIFHKLKLPYMPPEWRNCDP